MIAEQPTGGRTGGVYIPPFKLAMMKKQSEANDPANAENQKASWEALRKSINGLINKINVSNIKHIVPELFQENLIRGRGLFARAVMKAQLASPGFTHIYASLVAVINTKLPENGELILKRVIYGFKRAYKRRDKITATALARFIAHLVNHQVSHEILALHLLTVLLEEPTDDSVEIAVGFVKEVGQLLEELSPQGLHFVFERFRGILHEGDIDKRVQYTIEGLFAVRKSGFKDYPAIPKELDLVEREDQITFEIGMDDDIDKEEMLDIFRVDPNFEENERLWEQIKKGILGDDEDEEDGADGDDESEGNDGGEEQNGAQGGAMTVAGAGQVIDLTDAELVNLRRSIYLTIMSSVSFEECCHKIMKLNIPDGYESELANMLVECCSNERSYIRYYGLMGQRFCMMHRKYQDAFDQVFLQQYNTIHRLETNKLRNVAKFFGHLLVTDALPWTCLEYVKLNEYDTTSSSRIFIKILVQELTEMMGLAVVKERFSDPYMQDVFSGMFPTDNARNTRFAINFFTSIGLGGLTDGLREHLKNAPKLLALQMQAQLLEQQKLRELKGSASSDSSSSDSDSTSSSSSSSSSSGSSSSGSSSSSSSSSSDSDSNSGSSSSGSSSSSSSNSSSSSSSSSSDSSAPARKSKSSSKGSKATLNEKVKASRGRSRSPLPQANETNSRRRSPSPSRSRSPPRSRKQQPDSRSPSKSPPRRAVASRSPSRSPPRASKYRRSISRSPSRSPSRRVAATRSLSRSPPRRAAESSSDEEPRRPTTRARSVSPSPQRRRAASDSEGEKSPPRAAPARRSPSPSRSPPRQRQAASDRDARDTGARGGGRYVPKDRSGESDRRADSPDRRDRGAPRDSRRREDSRDRAHTRDRRDARGRDNSRDRGGRDRNNRRDHSRDRPRGASPQRGGWTRDREREKRARSPEPDTTDRRSARGRSRSRSPSDGEGNNKRRRGASP